MELIGHLGRRKAKLGRKPGPKRVYFYILTPQGDWVHCTIDGRRAEAALPLLRGHTHVRVTGRMCRRERDGTEVVQFRVRDLTVLPVDDDDEKTRRASDAT
jgi:hypothetical protein